MLPAYYFWGHPSVPYCNPQIISYLLHRVEESREAGN